jgi:hypothetical protein
MQAFQTPHDAESSPSHNLRFSSGNPTPPIADAMSPSILCLEKVEILPSLARVSQPEKSWVQKSF